MTRNDLKRVGIALHGPRWVRALARDYCCNHRSMQRWASGAEPLPRDMPHRLCEILSARIDLLIEVAETLEAIVDQRVEELEEKFQAGG